VMATSSQTYTLPFPLTAFDSGSPVATWIARDGVIETVNHLCDEQAQPRVNWVAADSALLSGGQTQYLTHPAPVDVTHWAAIAIFGPFPLSIREDGRNAYQLRTLIAGASSAGHAVEFGINLSASFSTRIAGLSDALGAVTASRGKEWDATSSASPAWLTPATGSHVLEVSPETVGEGTITIASPNDASPYDTPSAVQVSEAYAHVYAKTANLSSVGHLYALHVAEVIGT